MKRDGELFEFQQSFCTYFKITIIDKSLSKFHIFFCIINKHSYFKYYIVYCEMTLVLAIFYFKSYRRIVNFCKVLYEYNIIIFILLGHRPKMFINMIQYSKMIIFTIIQFLHDELISCANCSLCVHETTFNAKYTFRIWL